MYWQIKGREIPCVLYFHSGRMVDHVVENLPISWDIGDFTTSFY